MINIKELNILSFGKFKNKKLDLSPGLNIIYGENERGKSTIHKFIESIFFGFFKTYTKTKRYTKEYEKYFPWNESEYRGVVKYSYKGDIFRVERNFLKGKDDIKIFDDQTGEDISNMYEYNPITRLIEANSLHFGINKAIYKNTISISQLKSKTDNTFSKEVKDNLINLGGSLDNEISVKKVLERLENRAEKIGTKNRIKTSPYGKLIEDINKLNVEKKESKKIFEETKDLQIELRNQKEILNDFYSEKKDLEDKIHKYKCKELKNKYDKAKSLLNDIDELHRKSYSLKKFKDIKIEDYGDIIKYENSIKSIKDNIERLEKSLIEIEDKLKNIDKQIEDLNVNDIYKFNLDEKANQNQKIKKSKRLKIILLIISLTVLIISLPIAYLNNNIYFILSFFSVVASFYIFKKVRDDNNYILKNKGKIQSLESEKDMGEKELRETERFLQNQLLEKNTEIQRLKTNLNSEEMGISFILSKNNFNDAKGLKEGLEKKRKYHDILKEIDYKREILSNILMDKTIEDIKEEVETCSNIDLKGIKVEDSSMENFEELKNNIIKKDKEISNLEEKIKTMHSLFRPIQDIDEEIYLKKVKADKYESELKSIKIAKDTIEEISKDIHKEFAPRLNEKVSNIISNITKQKYRNVKITEDLKVKVVSKNDTLIDIEDLSYGTIDQLYFSLRFGIIDIIKDKQKLPLILDDCFVQYDDERLRSILDFIYNESKQRQIILFTCQNREKEILRNKDYEFNYIEI